MRAARGLVLFNYDWDQVGYGRWSSEFHLDSAGFDLFSFPSNAHLVTFDLQRFVDRLAARAARKGWCAVTSNHEQFGALAAAMLAERMGWPGTPVAAVLACQHKLHARRVLEQVAPEAIHRLPPLNWGMAIRCRTICVIPALSNRSRPRFRCSPVSFTTVRS